MDGGTADGNQDGVQFPLVDGRRSTSVTGRAVLADAARPVDPALADRIADERDWRTAYPAYFRKLVTASACNPARGVSVAADGLASLHRRFVVAGDDGDVPIESAMREPGGPRLAYDEVRGRGERETELSVPYGGRRLRGDELRRRLDRWVVGGIVEPSHADAVRRVHDNPGWLDLSDHAVVLLGAGAEMAPLHSLLRWGATVHAVDVRRRDVWRRILGAAYAGAGRLVVPVRDGTGRDGTGGDLAARAGADLLTEAAAVRRWLAGVDGRLVLGNYGYADGATFVRLAMAVDALTTALLTERPDTALAMLATPTDVFAVPPETVAHARDRYRERRWRRLLQAPVRTVTRRRAYAPHYATTVHLPDGREVGIADCLVVQQGPNYALAKQLQRWRAVVAHAGGATVSANVAPPTRTRSVLSNRVLAAAYAGAHRFGVEIFAPATSSTLMAALLVHDLRQPPGPLAHPHDLFALGANHGGLWRMPYEPRSVLGLAVLLGLLQRRR